MQSPAPLPQTVPASEAARGPRLWHWPLSPACRKVRLSLGERRIEVELVVERYWERDPDHLRRSPTGRVPVLRMDGRLMTESAAICEYVEETRGGSLVPADPAARYEMRRIVGWFDDAFAREVTERLLGERLMRKVRGDGYPDSAAVKAGSAAIRTHLGAMTELLDGRRWLAGDAMSLADFAAAAHLSCLDYISDVPWDRFEDVRDWYAKIKSRPAFRGILTDTIPGHLPPRHYADLDF